MAAAIGVHIIEEYALNFTGWAAAALSAPISWDDFHLVNAGVTLYIVSCAAVGWRAPAFCLSGAALLVCNALGFHLGASLVSRMYSPGTVTALLLFVPVGLGAYRSAARRGLLTRRVLAISIAIGLLWHAFLALVFYIKYFAPLYS